MIAVENLIKHYGRASVLAGMSFRAEPGQLTLLIGANGAGKTTTVRILAGLTRPDGGAAFIEGKDVVRERIAAQSRLSFLPQGVAFHPRLSSRHILRFYARLRGCPAARAEEMLALAGLGDHATKPAGALSGGLRQRLGLALLLLPDAPVLLLDEPGLSLDPEWRDRLQSLLVSEARRGKTVLVTTHLLAEWEGVADRCLLCQDGRIAGEIDPNNLRGSLQTSAPKMRAVAA